MTQAHSLPMPKGVKNAVQAIWLTNIASAFLIAANYVEATVDSIVINGIFLLVCAIVTLRISAGSNLARLFYAFLVALEVAILMAFGLTEANDLELLLTYLTLPLEAWILVTLFRPESDEWFAAKKMKPPSGL